METYGETVLISADESDIKYPQSNTVSILACLPVLPKEYIIIISTIIIYFVIIMFALRVMIKSFKEHLKSGRIFVTALLIVLLSTAATYFIALFFKKFDIVEQVGSADAWISFAGAGMSGIITMLALYFTLKSNEETNKANQMASLRPYIVCNITNLDKEKNKIIIENYIDNYDFFECKMKNISNNIANGIKIIDEFSSVQIEENKYKKFDDLFDLLVYLFIQFLLVMVLFSHHKKNIIGKQIFVLN